MPEQRDATGDLAASLQRLGAGARDSADTLLAAFPAAGAVSTQQAVDGVVDAAADLLRAVGAEALDLAGSIDVSPELRAASRR